MEPTIEPAGSVKARKPRVKGYKRQHKEMRKVVPQRRRFDRNKPGDLIAMKACQMDITREQLGAAVGMTRGYVNKLLITAPKYLRPIHLKLFGEALGMTDVEMRRLYHVAALEQGYEIGPYIPEKKRVEEAAEE